MELGGQTDLPTISLRTPRRTLFLSRSGSVCSLSSSPHDRGYFGT